MHKIQPFPSWGSLRLPREIREQRQLNEQARRSVCERKGGEAVALPRKDGEEEEQEKASSRSARSRGSPWIIGLKVDAG